MTGRTNAGGGGGIVLNYKVVGGTSAPATPSENTIWIDTENTITSHIFSATEPESPSEGMVWISTGTASEVAFSATEENPIMLYPMSAAQYVSGTWVAVTAKSYQNGAWVNWIRYLYNTGDEYTDITGGWTTKALVMSSSGTAKAPTITRNTTDMKIVQGTASAGGIAYCAQKINLTNFNTLNFDGIIYGGGSATAWAGLYVWSAIGTTYKTNVVASNESLKDATSGVRTVDISELSGEYYIGFGVYSDSSYVTMRKLYLS